ncbi:MAG: phosphoglucomutase/phosphomannomutase family protein [Bacteroidota bacterium]|nr:phosphoglucomutase/phosphomannomutase family protein [Candidatus Kapabacteria bacterium]MDW8219477.1 phosphoglucomutase/phosphomannomutase family protein [Bacteroidota bacterium]
MIVFGTDGWRGIIARDFTFENVQLVALATAQYALRIDKKKASVVIGYDARFLSKEFAQEAACVLASKGVVVHITETIASTPQVSFATKQKKATLGVVITASHNPAEYNGYKLKSNTGGPAFPEQIAELEKELAAIERKRPVIKFKSFDDYVKDKIIRPFGAKESYLRYVKRKIDMTAITKAGIKVLFDPMHGAGINTIKDLLPSADEIHGEYNPSFGEIHHPEPMAEYLPTLIEKVKEGKYDIGLATDGDADRLGAVDENGHFVDSHKVFMLIMKYLYEDKKKRGAVAKTIALTSMVNKYCEKHGIKLYELPIGFKHVSKLMATEKILIGGEESGGLGTIIHIPERDGIFNGMLLLEMMAKRKKKLSELVEELEEEFGVHRYRRRDVRTTEKMKQDILKACAKKPKQLGRYKVVSIDTTDGYKFFIDNGWLLIRASGTEPLLRYYAEADSMNKVNELLEEGLKLK